MSVCTLEYDSIDIINNIFLPLDSNNDEFNEQCHYCFKKIIAESERYALKCGECSEPEIVHICNDCYADYKHEQRTIARKLLKEFLTDYDLEILEDHSSYSDDPSSAQYDNHFFVNRSSDLLITAPDYIIVASSIAGCMQVGHRSNINSKQRRACACQKRFFKRTGYNRSCFKL